MNFTTQITELANSYNLAQQAFHNKSIEQRDAELAFRRERAEAADAKEKEWQQVLKEMITARDNAEGDMREKYHQLLILSLIHI